MLESRHAQAPYRRWREGFLKVCLKTFKISFSVLLQTSRTSVFMFGWFNGVLSLAKWCRPMGQKLRWHAFAGGPVGRTHARETRGVVCVLEGSPLDPASEEALVGS